MTLDVDAYRINIPFIASWRNNRPEESIIDAIGLMAIAYDVPIIVVCHYIGELEGYSGELKAFIERLMLFYRVDKVLGTRDTEFKETL